MYIMCVSIKKNIFRKWCLCGIVIRRFYVTKLNYMYSKFLLERKLETKICKKNEPVDKTESDMQHPISLYRAFNQLYFC